MRIRSIIVCLLFIISFIGLSISLTSCGGEDRPFVFDGSDTTGGGGDDDDGQNPTEVECDEDQAYNSETEKCEEICEKDIQCSPGEYCDTETNFCKEIPLCQSPGECPEDWICDTANEKCVQRQTLDDYCATDEDCPDSNKPKCQVVENPVNNKCVPTSTCLNPPTCRDNEYLDPDECRCVGGNICIIKFRARIKIYIDSPFNVNDLPNPCDEGAEEWDFGCIENETPETDPVFLDESILRIVDGEEFKKGECYRMTRDTQERCESRANVPIVPMLPRTDGPVPSVITLKLNRDTGEVAIEQKTFPQYMIYNCSGALPAELILDAGGNESDANLGGLGVLNSWVGRGTFEETLQGIKFENIGMYFRTVAHALTDPIHPHNPPESYGCRRHNDDPQAWFMPDNGTIAGGPPYGDFVNSTTYLPPYMPGGSTAAEITTEPLDVNGAPGVSDVNTIRLVGERLHIVQDPDSPFYKKPYMRLVLGVAIPTDDQVLNGIQGAALGAELVPASECSYADYLSWP